MALIQTLAAATALVGAANDVIQGRGPIVEGANKITGSSGGQLARRGFGMVLRAGETNVSLAQYTAQTAIRTRAFIDSRLAQEEVLPNMLRAIRSYYLAQVLSAIQLGQLVSRGRTVQDVFGAVQTGESPHMSNAAMGAFQRMAGLESLMCELDTPGFIDTVVADQIGTESLGAAALSVLTNVGPDVAMALLKKGITDFRLRQNQNYTPASRTTAQTLQDEVGKTAIKSAFESLKQTMPKAKYDRLDAELKAAKTQAELKNIAKQAGLDEAKLDAEIASLERKIGLDEAMDAAKMRAAEPGPSTISADQVSLEVNQSIATGDLYMVTLTNPENPKASIQVPVLLQMLPMMVPAQIMPRMIDRQMAPTLWQRLIQRSVGEISFFADFIGQRDLLERQAMPSDPESARVLKTFLHTINKKDAYSRADIASSRPTADMSKNLQNTVMVFSEQAIIDAQADSGIDLRNANDRERYFRDTYTMIIAIVDPAFQRVQLFINGIDGAIDASYNDFKPKQKNFDPTDLLASLASLASGRRPPL